MAKEQKGKGGKGEAGSTEVTKFYGVSGSTLERKKKSCPKCGPGYFLAEHKDRTSCGKCGYTEFKKK